MNSSLIAARRREPASAVLASVAIALLLAGCATTSVSNRQSNLGEHKLRKPDTIHVFDFAASQADMYGESAYSSQISASTAAGDQLALGRELGRRVAERITENINDMGLRAVAAGRTLNAKPGDIIIRGFFRSIEEGSAGKRTIVGFGSGKAELTTVVEGYVMTDRGPRRLGTATIDSEGGKKPGMLVPVAVAAATASPAGLAVGGAMHIAGEVSGSSRIEGEAKRTADEISEQLEERFKDQGWID